jgi:hypothetical protein
MCSPSDGIAPSSSSDAAVFRLQRSARSQVVDAVVAEALAARLLSEVRLVLDGDPVSRMNTWVHRDMSASWPMEYGCVRRGGGSSP